jgi:hypothetical protein
MSSTIRVWLSLTLGLVLLLPAHGEEKGTEAAKKSEAAKVGNELLFMVADFAEGGPFKGHCGCPSVMIGNHDAKGIVIWSKTADSATLKLAKSANELIGDDHKKQGYLILFDTKDADFAATAKQAALNHVTLGISRLTAKQVFGKAEVDPELSQVVMLIDDKIIKAIYPLKVNELTAEKSQEIVKATTAFLR